MTVLDVGGIKERIERFDAAHGHCVMQDGWLLFADGAMRETNPLGRLIEPSDTDDYTLAKRLEAYYRILFEHAAERFRRRWQDANSHVRALLTMPNSVPPWSPQELTAELTDLQRQVKAAKKAHDASVAEVEKHKPQQLRISEETDRHNRVITEQLLAVLDRIQV